MTKNNYSIEASIIIPSYNSLTTIKECIQSVLNQDYQKEKYEIIVVDDGSKDGLDSFISQLPVILIKQKHSGPGAARNNGVRHARGEIIIFLDSDCTVPIDWLRLHVKTHIDREKDNKNFSCIGGPVKLLASNSNFFQICDYYSSWYSPPKVAGSLEYEYLPSTNLSLKRNTFDKIGGFNENLWRGEDVDFGIKMRRLTYNIIFEPKIYCYHIGRRTLKSYLLHNYNWGRYVPYFRRFGSGAKYNYLFPPNVILSLLLSPLIVFCYTIYIILKWFFQGVFFILLISPMVFISRVVYAIGILGGILKITNKKKIDNDIQDYQIRVF